MNIQAYTKATMSRKPLIVQCCVCRRIRHLSGRWDIIPHLPDTDISHTYCETCAQQILKELRGK